ncbi:MAG: class I SAM-dependent rRNA methyltransferase [Anaerolineae bacterium]
MSEAGRVVLKPGRERSVLNRHPWLFSGGIATAKCEDGEVAEVYGADGRWLARGYYNSRSQIRLHLLTWRQDEAIDDGFWRGRVLRAIEARRRLPGVDGTGLRLANAESDGLPGLVADLYVDVGGQAVVVLQALTLGIERRKQTLAAILAEELRPETLPAVGGWSSLSVHERSDVDVRRLEGLEPAVGPLVGEVPPDYLTIREGPARLLVDVKRGHKTGFYLDQRGNRALVAGYCREAEVLNCFAFSGGFSVQALLAGAAAVTDVDTSGDALEIGRRNAALNGCEERRSQVEGDVFQVLRQMRDRGRSFDAIILDPPKFAYRGDQVQAACRGYKDINLLALSLIRPGGILATFSCSGLVSADLFQKVVFGAAVDAGREAQILEFMSQGPDHPISLTFPEGHYLKGLICRVW